MAEQPKLIEQRLNQRWFANPVLNPNGINIVCQFALYFVITETQLTYG